jgi:hypothetical protein
LDAVGIALQGLASGSNLSAIAAMLRGAAKTNIYQTYSMPKLDWAENELRRADEIEQNRRNLITEGRTNEAARLPVYVIRPKPAWLLSAEKPADPKEIEKP